MFEGQRVRIRALERSDREKYLSWMNRLDLGALSGTYQFPGTEDHPRFTQQWPVLLIIETKDKEPIGGLAVGPFDWVSRGVEMGAAIGEDDYRHRGYFKEAILLLLDHLFGQVGVDRIYGATKESNEVVTGMSLHFGATAEARIPCWEFYRGRLLAGVHVSLTRDEYYRQVRPLLVDGS